MYQRERVYPALAFDEFVHAKTMHSSEKLEGSHFISDRAAFDEVLLRVEDESAPLFVNLVTMQNHYPMHGIYDNPIDADGLADHEERAQAGGYARGLRYTDEALSRFLSSLELADEKTIVVFYGDHQPAIWSGDTQALNGERILKETVFFVWSNSADLEPRHLPTTSPIYFINHVFETANATVPPFYALLTEREREIPAVEHGIMIGPGDHLIDERDLSPRAKQLLNDYRMVQYDLSVGQRYVEEQMLYGDASSAVADSN